MKFYVNANAPKDGNGSQANPFRTINEAAKLAQPGDEVLVAPGIYREYVDPINAGTEDARITYTSTTPLGAVITGAEEVKNWKQKLKFGNRKFKKLGNKLNLCSKTIKVKVAS